jgi:hypothetical protein
MCVLIIVVLAAVGYFLVGQLAIAAYGRLAAGPGAGAPVTLRGFLRVLRERGGRGSLGVAVLPWSVLVALWPVTLDLTIAGDLRRRAR